MLGGSIASMGKSYSIELKTTDCETGATLSREQVEALDKEHVLQALAKAPHVVLADRLVRAIQSLDARLA